MVEEVGTADKVAAVPSRRACDQPAVAGMMRMLPSKPRVFGLTNWPSSCTWAPNSQPSTTVPFMTTPAVEIVLWVVPLGMDELLQVCQVGLPQPLQIGINLRSH